MPSEPIRVAVAQAVAVPGDVERNVATTARLIRGARADVVVFPELFLCCYDLSAVVDVTEDDRRLEPVGEACRDAGATAVVGASVRVGKGRRISALVIGPGGETVARAD